MPVQFAPNYGQNTTFDQALQAFGLLSKLNLETQDLALKNQVTQSQLATDTLQRQVYAQKIALDQQYAGPERQQALDIGASNLRSADLGYQQGQANLVSTGLQQDAAKLGIYNTIQDMPYEDQKRQLGLQTAQTNIAQNVAQTEQIKAQTQIVRDAQKDYSQIIQAAPGMLKQLGYGSDLAQQVMKLPGNVVVNYLNQAFEGNVKQKLAEVQINKTRVERAQENISHILGTFSAGAPEGDLAALRLNRETVASAGGDVSRIDKAISDVQSMQTDEQKRMSTLESWLGDSELQSAALEMLSNKELKGIPVDTVFKPDASGVILPTKDYSKLLGPAVNYLASYKANRQTKTEAKTESKSPAIVTSTTATTKSSDTTIEARKPENTGSWSKYLQTYKGVKFVKFPWADKEYAVREGPSGEDRVVVGSDDDTRFLPVGTPIFDIRNNKTGTIK